MSKVENHGEEEYRSETSIRKTLTLCIRELNQEQWKNRDGGIGVEGGKGVGYQWKEESQCSQGDRCRFRHEAQDRAQKPEHTAASPSEPIVPGSRSVSKRSIRGKNNHGSILRQQCRYYLRGSCTRTSCEHRHFARVPIFLEMKQVARLETSVCLRITRLMNYQIQSRKNYYSP